MTKLGIGILKQKGEELSGVYDGIKGTVTFGDVGKGMWVASRGTSSHKK